MQKLRNKIQEKKAELKLDNAELGLAIGRGERYIDRLLRDTVSTAKQEEVIGLLDGLDCKEILLEALESKHVVSCMKESYRDGLASKNAEILALENQHESTKSELRKLTVSAGSTAEQFDRSAKQLAASVAQNEKLKEQIENMAMQLTNVELDNKELQGTADNALKNVLECRESASRKIQELESNLDQTGSALRFMKIMCIVLALICAVIISTSVFR